MKPKKLGAVAVACAVLTVITVKASDLKVLAHFGAPAVAGKSNVMDADRGAIVFDTTDGNFWGYGNNGGWVRMSGASSSSVQPGVMMPYVGAAAPAGYVLASGKTIGNASSGASERANADTEALFVLLWNSWSNTELPIQDSSGNPTTRGASASADFAADKRLPLPDLRGRIPVGKDDMGGTTAGRMTVAVSGTTLGASGGGEVHTLVVSEMPVHSHNLAMDDYNSSAGVQGMSTGGGGMVTFSAGAGLTYKTTNGQAEAMIATEGGGGAHNNTQPSLVMTYIIKL